MNNLADEKDGIQLPELPEKVLDGMRETLRRGDALHGCQLALSGREDQLRAALSALEEARGKLVQQQLSEPQDYWRYFHCDFYTRDAAEAEAHFGDRDDAEEFKPICKWWARMDDTERKHAFQDVIQQLNDERNPHV